MDRPLGLEDLQDVHPEIYDSLKKLLAHEGSVEDMGLFFQVLCMGSRFLMQGGALLSIPALSAAHLPEELCASTRDSAHLRKVENVLSAVYETQVLLGGERRGNL